MDGVSGMFPVRLFTLESHFFVEGVMAILARESFSEMERRRLCGDCLRIGDAAFVLEFS